jgi:hypothetical protein
MTRYFIQAFEGPGGRCELWENVGFDPRHPLLEQVEYQVVHGAGTYAAATMGEAAIVACELVGDPRYSQPVLPTRNSPSAYR